MFNIFTAFTLLQDYRESFLFQSDKIYAVVTIVLLIFLGFLGYLLFTSRKVNALEKQMDELEKQSQSS